MTDPKVVDAELAELYGTKAALQGCIRQSVLELHHLVGDLRDLSRNQFWIMTDEEAEGNARDGVGVQRYDQARLASVLGRLDGYRVELEAAYTRIEELNARYTGWSRFFLVPEGHIHSSMGCSTCNNGKYMTQFGWLPQLSGENEADAVAAHGALLCTVCYPSAPVEWTNKYELDAAAKAASRCAGSGTYAKTNRRSAVCPACGKYVTVTPNCNFRAH